MTIHDGIPTTIQASVILLHGIMIAVFVYAPIAIIVFRELDKLSRRNNEDLSMSSSASYAGITFITLAVVAILYILLMFFEELIFPSVTPVGGENGVTRLFWNIAIPDSTPDGMSGMGVAALHGIYYIRGLIETTAFMVMVLLLMYSVQLTFSAISNYSDGSQRSSMGVAIVKGILGLMIGAIMFEYYSYATSWMLNHPSHTLRSLATQWATEALTAAGGDGI